MNRTDDCVSCESLSRSHRQVYKIGRSKIYLLIINDNKLFLGKD